MPQSWLLGLVEVLRDLLLGLACFALPFPQAKQTTEIVKVTGPCR
jgi:hypothetical protein